MLTDISFLAVAIPAVLVTGLSKGGFGGGIAMLGTPLIALVMPPFQAAAIMLPVLLLMDAVGLWSYRGRVDWQTIRLMLPGAFSGLALGWATAAYVSDSAIRMLVGVIAIAFALIQIRAELRRLAPRNHDRRHAAVWSTIAGYTSFIAHAGGPPYQAYTLPLKMDKLLYAGTGVVFFAIVNATKVGPYLALGQFNTDNLARSGLLLPVAVAGVLCGVWLVKRVSQQTFYNITYAAMLLVGGKLLWDGASGLAGLG